MTTMTGSASSSSSTQNTSTCGATASASCSGYPGGNGVGGSSGSGDAGSGGGQSTPGSVSDAVRGIGTLARICLAGMNLMANGRTDYTLIGSSAAGVAFLVGAFAL